MSATWTCNCGTIFPESRADGDRIRCSECGFVVEDSVALQTGVQVEPPPRTVLACPKVAVQTTAPSVKCLPVTELATDVDIRSFVWDPCILLGSLLIVSIVSGFLIYGLCRLDVMDCGYSLSDAAAAQIRGPLTQACEAYRHKHGKYPDHLGVLLDPDEHGIVYIDRREGLIDPWRRPYQYDPKGPMNEGRRPDIWTVTPDGKVIGNWSKLPNRR